MIQLIIEFLLVGLVGGLLGIFYRDCLKPEGMIFNFLYRGLFKPWVKKGHSEDATAFERFKAWAAYPLGFCIYCSTTWITIFLCIIYLTSWEVLPKWQDICIGVIAALGMQHLVVASACRWLIFKHPDLDISFNKEQNKENTEASRE